MSCFVFSMQYPFSGCGLLSKKQYAASAAIILMMKLFTDLCLECTSCAVFLSMSLMVSMMHLFRSITLSHIGMSLFFMFALIPVHRPKAERFRKNIIMKIHQRIGRHVGESLIAESCSKSNVLYLPLTSSISLCLQASEACEN